VAVGAFGVHEPRVGVAVYLTSVLEPTGSHLKGAPKMVAAAPHVPSVVLYWVTCGVPHDAPLGVQLQSEQSRVSLVPV
jgi:hypothetical protein